MPVAIATAIVGASTGIMFTIVSTIVSVGLSYLAQTLFTPGGNQSNVEPEDQGVLTNKVSNNAPIPVVYGFRKVGGSKVYQACNNDNKNFWMCIVLGEGEVEGIQKVYIDDDELVLSSLNANTHITTTSSKDAVSVDTLQTSVVYRITSIKQPDWRALGGVLAQEVGDLFTSTVTTNVADLATYGTVGEVKSRYTGHCEFYYKTGTTTQSAITKANFNNDATFPLNWDVDKRLLGLCYIMCKFTYDRDVFRGIPNVVVDLKGVKVPDVLGTITNKKWDRNPSAILYDYLTNTTYGRGLSAAQMDIASFRAAYNHCNTTLEIYDTFAENFINNGTKYRILTVASANWSSVGGPTDAKVGDIFTGTVQKTVAQSAVFGTVIGLSTGAPPPKSLEAILGGSEQKLFRLDGVLNVDENTFDNTKKILSSCRGFLIFSAGKYKLVIDKFENAYSRFTVKGIAQNPSILPFLFDESNTIGAIDITLGDKSNTYNRARYSFFNPQKNWMYDTVFFDDPNMRNDADRGVVLEQSVRMDFVASRYCAQEIVRQNLRQSRQQIVVGFQTNISALANDVGDIVDITNENAGWYQKQFRLLRLELQEDGNVKVVMVEYNSGVYDVDATGLIFENDSPDTDLPNPFATTEVPNAPTVANANLAGKNAIGIVIPVGRVKVSWGKAVDPFIDYYELQYAVLDQAASAVNSIVIGNVYKIAAASASNWSASSVGGPASAVVGDTFKAASTVSVSSLGTVTLMTADSAGFSTVRIPTTQIDSSNNLVEFVENLSPTTGYAFRTRFVRTNSVYSGYSLVTQFVTAGVSQSVGASYINVIEATAGNSEMLNNAGTVTYTSFLLKGGVKLPHYGQSGTEVNSYAWYYTPAGGSRAQITNSNKAAVTGSTANNSLGGGGTAYDAVTLTVEADGTALGATTSGSATFTCEINYTPT